MCDLLIMEGELNDARQVLEALPDDTEGVDRPKSRLELVELAGDLSSLDELAAGAKNGDLQARFDLAIRLIIEDRIEQGLETLLEIMKIDRAWEEEKARLTMIKVFNMLGKGNELATGYRRKMFTYLH